MIGAYAFWVGAWSEFDDMKIVTAVVAKLLAVAADENRNRVMSIESDDSESLLSKVSSYPATNPSEAALPVLPTRWSKSTGETGPLWASALVETEYPSGAAMTCLLKSTVGARRVEVGADDGGDAAAEVDARVAAVVACAAAPAEVVECAVPPPPPPHALATRAAQQVALVNSQWAAAPRRCPMVPHPALL